MTGWLRRLAISAKLLTDDGIEITVDEIDKMFALSFRLSATGGRNGDYIRGYKTGMKRPVGLHRLISERAKFDMTNKIDHRNGDLYDFRRENLRPATDSQNQCNRPAPVTNTSGQKGVSWDESRQKWFAKIQIKRRQIALGRFDSYEEACQEYRKAAEKYHGEFAKAD